MDQLRSIGHVYTRGEFLGLHKGFKASATDPEVLTVALKTKPLLPGSVLDVT